ncbi:MAG: PaaI family thioesterase [Rhodobacter sp.]|nr:PaaI family thioesterase [Rhodobacter sp.]
MQDTAFDDIATKIRASFARQDMMRTLRAGLDVVDPGCVVISAPVLPEMRQQHGFAHAAVSFALGDSAAGYAALSVMAPDDEVLTAEMKINLLAPASGDRLEARGHVIRAGRRLVVVGATVVAVDGATRRDVAVLQGTMIPVTG